MAIIIAVLLSNCSVLGFETEPPEFDGAQAYEDVEFQVGLGPRTPGSPGHEAVRDWIGDELGSAGWQVEHQETEIYGFPIKNIIATRSSQADEPWIIVGAHYDTRFFADKDPEIGNRGKPVPGANDGASGVAVLLELARNLPEDMGKNIWLVFFDEEDNGEIDNRLWAMGSTAFVRDLEGRPDSVVIVDMVGDKDLNIFYETNSTLDLSAEIWSQAAALGYVDHFIPAPRYTIIDDHIPFLSEGIPAVDIIDFDFAYHHTLQDTVDKVSAESLAIVGSTILAWLLGGDG